MEHKLFLIDNGHGLETPGKRSPDGNLLEYQYNRIIAVAVLVHLAMRGVRAELVVPEDNDIEDPERTNNGQKHQSQNKLHIIPSPRERLIPIYMPFARNRILSG